MLMMNAKKLLVILGFVALGVLVTLPGGAWAEMYVEGFLGGVQPGNSGDVFFTRHPGNNTYEFNNPIGIYTPQVIGGAKVGTWFVKEGFLGFNYPDWMKYTGFYLEFSYHRLNNPNQGAHTYAFSPNRDSGRRPSVFSSEGMATTLAFMFAGRYGFFPDNETPFGRLQPYIGVGPAIIFTSMAPRLLTYTYGGQRSGAKVGNETVANLGICADLGVRWMALKNVSIDVFYTFRYVRPKYSYDYTDPVTGLPTFMEITPGSGGNELHSGHVGVAYHF